MLCPKCKREGKNVEMEVIETMRVATSKRVIKYKCGECGNEEYSIKKIPEEI